MSLTRRATQSVANAASFASLTASRAGAFAAVAARGSFSLARAADLEVPTVTDTSVAFTWATYGAGIRTPLGPVQGTVPAGERVLVGPVDGPMELVHDDPTPRGYHHVVVDGLEPGRTYRFECWSDGHRARPSLLATRRAGAPEATGTVTTLSPPEGPRLGRIAVANDSHIGRPAHDSFTPPGRRPLREAPGQRAFAAMQLEGLVEGVRAAGADALVVNGDCTDGGQERDVDEFTDIMDGFGRMHREWFATRGNHDNRVPGLPAIADERMEMLDDPFARVSGPRQTHWTAEAAGVRLVGLDTNGVNQDGGHMSEAQITAVREELLREPDQPTLVFGHHPVTSDAGRSNIAGKGFILPEDQALRLQASVAEAPGVAAVFAGHTHRSRRGVADIGGADYCERGASVGYPGGFTLVDVYAGGLMVTFHRTPTRESLDWSARTRWSMFGYEPEYMLGRVEDRNYVVHRTHAGVRARR
ncbi:metallophosphoesterase family protein [Corynebacterium sp.]|uniref:purple acid phosphatase family protein n=1 Tax=Corynebacterium sp. TaxID=1720 RepID=UPI0026DB208E|nr:metallophosphoesterase family protein [Corynebacterium sp.]MDO4609727.1 metallophosphoesterase family protein [Corynebacterium sp.]